jgi:hypothetical protein
VDGAGLIYLTFMNQHKVAVYSERDHVWVSSLNDRVQCFTPEGRYFMGITAAGKEQGRLTHPHGMAFDSEGRLYVADAGSQRILGSRSRGREPERARGPPPATRALAPVPLEKRRERRRSRRGPGPCKRIGAEEGPAETSLDPAAQPTGA